MRRTLFHLGADPWPEADTLHTTKENTTLPHQRPLPGTAAPPKTSCEVKNASMPIEAFLKSTLDQLLTYLRRTIREQEKPTLIVAGGTIDTEPDPHTGTRIPNHNRQKQRLQALMAKTHHQRSPFHPSVPDSSNIVPALQQKLMESIFTEVEQNLKSMNASMPACFQGHKGKTKQTAIPADEIPKYFNTPRKWGRGIYVTHGSDTLAIDAALAAYLFRGAHLVSVWTGAWNSRNEPGFDGTLNEMRARRLAEHPYTPPGSYVVIGEQIHLASKAMKINNHPFSPIEIPHTASLPYTPGANQVVSYFASLDDQPVGYFDESNKPCFYTRFLRQQERHAAYMERFPSSAKLIDHYHQKEALKPAYVEHVVINHQAPAAVFEDLCKRLEKKGPYTGAIVEGPLTERNDWPQLREKIQALKNENIYILPPGKELTPYQAQLKLSALLSEKNASIEENMRRDLTGESVLPSVARRELYHFPKGFFKSHEWIQGSPALEPEVIKDATKRLVERHVEKPTIVINGTGDGHIPIGPLTLEQRLVKGYGQLGQAAHLKRLQAEMERYGADYSLSNIQDALVRLYSRHAYSNSNEPEHVKQIARDELKRVLRHSDPMLEAVGDALDRGIQVQMGTQVTYAKPNLSTYEIGSILKFIGVKEFPQKFTENRRSSKL